MRTCERRTRKARLLARGRALLDAFLQQSVSLRLHNARADNAAALLSLAKPAQAGRLAHKVYLRVTVSLLVCGKRLYHLRCVAGASPRVQPTIHPSPRRQSGDPDRSATRKQLPRTRAPHDIESGSDFLQTISETHSD
jgi:hypothetical protein